MNKNIELSKKTVKIKKWLDLLNNEPAPFLSHIEKNYLSDENILNSEKELFLKVLEHADNVLRTDEDVAIIRIPGRVNLLGMHIDHRMGAVNPIATNTMAMVVQPRNDDRIHIYNCSPNFKHSSFSINELLPGEKIADWDTWTKKNLEIRIQQRRSHDWINYFQAASLYLQNYIKNEGKKEFPRLSGFNAVVNSNIPYAVGLSSSSSLVVGATLALMAINNIRLSDEEFIDFCGAAEWYVGTRGGKGDHAAMYIGKKGHISHISFNPFSVSFAPFPKEYCIALCNSMIKASKIAGARNKFNTGVANYEIGFLLLKKHFPKLSNKIKYLRDVTPERLNISESEIYSMVKSLPDKITRNQLINQFPENKKDWEWIFSTHEEPEEGYRVRDVSLYGIAECIRSEKSVECLKRGDTLQFGKLMNISHDGDRVTQIIDGNRLPYIFSATDDFLDSLIKKVSSEKDNEQYKLYQQPGGYAMSCAEPDELVDIALETDGVAGARLVGAGMGGCVAVLIENNRLENLITRVTNLYYKPKNFSPAVEICFPVDGADFINTE